MGVRQTEVVSSSSHHSAIIAESSLTRERESGSQRQPRGAGNVVLTSSSYRSCLVTFGNIEHFIHTLCY